MTSHKTVVVTGFGPFGEHKVNASWQAVQELEQIGLLNNVSLITKEMPVVYDDVKTIVPSIWKDQKPQLVIHVGVSGEAREITLEQLARNSGYCKHDIQKKTPQSECCVDDGDECLQTKFDLQKVCDVINGANDKLKAIISTDPGRYLCEFSYYLSLHQNCSAAIFVHVPPIGSPYTAAELANGLRIIIQCLLEQQEEFKENS
ncbi:pyroglutamyl-peptidase 1-like [Ptychodera flava]|uniref:pyroglutamyl-peptidase 1-like n=1 Tax=Ptychodera flava TaxID=63121 RepID=UPI00396A8BAE